MAECSEDARGRIMTKGAAKGAVAPLAFSRSKIEGLAHSVIEVNRDVLSQRGFLVTAGSSSFEEGQFEQVVSVVSSSFSTYFGVTPSARFVDLFEQMSVFAFNLAKDHIFTDGNKRTTVLVSLALVRIGGVFLDIEDSEIPEENEVYKWIEDLVTDSKSKEELADILRMRAVLDPGSPKGRADDR